MSTNYYFTPREWTEPEPDTILDIVSPNRRERPMIHLGKCAGGVKFMLHVYPEHNVNKWEDWKRLINSRKDWHVASEYDVGFTDLDIERMIDQLKTGSSNPGYVSHEGDYTCHSGDWC